MAKFAPIFVFIAFIAVALATPVVRRDVSELLRHHEPGHVVYGNGIPGNEAEIERQHFEIDEDGNYNFGYKQTDLQQRDESGTITTNEQTGERELDNVVGSYKYLRPDGLWQIVTYTADSKNGFVPSILVTKDEVSNDSPIAGLIPANLPVLSSTEKSSTTTAAGRRF